MSEIEAKNEQVLINYLVETEKVCPELLELLYPITFISIDFLSVFDDDIELDEESEVLDKLDIKETIKLVKEFLNKHFKEYIEDFNESLNNGAFDIFYMDDIDFSKDRYEEPMTLENEKHVNINVPLTSTIDDGAIILHEFFHYTNSHITGVREIFTELISIYVEFRYFQFLCEKGYNVDNYYKEIYNRLKYTYNSANNIAYSGSILDVYHNTGEVSEESIRFIDQNRDLYSDDIDNILGTYDDDNLDELIYDFEYDVSYVLGGIIAFNLIKDPVINDIRIKYINENIDKLSIKDILSILGIDIKDFQDLVDNCKNTFDKLGCDKHEKTYMYSGPDRSR